MRRLHSYRTVFGSLIASLALSLASPVGAHPLVVLKAMKGAEQSRIAPVPPLVAKSAVTAAKAPSAPKFKRRPGPPLPPPLTLKAMN